MQIVLRKGGEKDDIFVPWNLTENQPIYFTFDDVD